MQKMSRDGASGWDWSTEVGHEKIDVAALQNNLAKHGILVSSTVPNTLRLVTHLDIPEEAIDVVIDRVQKSMEIMIV